MTIDKDIILEIDRETLLQEYIPKADYENRLKADMVAMLEELDLQLDEMKIIRPQHNMPKYQIDPYRHGVNDSKKKIQDKINALKGDTNDSKNSNGDNLCGNC